jgi:hypothetical protein
MKTVKAEDFIPGNEIKISLGYNDKKETVFEGIIVSQGLSVKNGKSQLLVTCKDKTVKMTKGRFNALFTDQKDSDAITRLPEIMAFKKKSNLLTSNLHSCNTTAATGILWLSGLSRTT